MDKLVALVFFINFDCPWAVILVGFLGLSLNVFCTQTSLFKVLCTKPEYNLSNNLKEISLKKWHCTRLTWYFRMLIHRCHSTTEHSPAVFYFGSDCEFYTKLIGKSLTAERYFSVFDNQKCLAMIHNPLFRDAQASSEPKEQCPLAHWHRLKRHIALCDVLNSDEKLLHVGWKFKTEKSSTEFILDCN